MTELTHEMIENLFIAHLPTEELHETLHYFETGEMSAEMLEDIGTADEAVKWLDETLLELQQQISEIRLALANTAENNKHKS